MGRYLYSFDAVTGNESNRSPIETLFSYGTIPLSTICRYLPTSDLSEYGDIDGVNGTGCSSGSSQLGATASSFSYAVEVDGNYVYPSVLRAIGDTSSTCRSIDLQFAENSSDSGLGFDLPTSFETYVEVSQPSASSVSASASPDTIGSVTVTLHGGGWDLYVATNDSAAASQDGSYGGVLLNGDLSCYTPTGKQSTK
jgi:hypothetical protein